MIAILAIRLISLWHNNSELFFDEAQYWYWAQTPAFGYFSKPPMLAWLIALSTDVCGSSSEFCVRLAAPIIHCLTAFMIALAASHWFDRKTGFVAGVIYALLPGVSLSSTLISTDVPLLFFWSVALYAWIRLAEKPAWSWTLLLGAALGAGMLSKYAMIYFVIGGVICLRVVGRTHAPPAKHLLIAITIAALCFAPNVVWNLQNGFATLSHTGENIGWSGVRFNVAGALEFLGAQFGVFGPILFGVFLATLARLRSPEFDHRHHALLCFSVPVLVLIIFQALMSKAYANWAATAYVAASILVADVLIRLVPPVWSKVSTTLHVVIFLVLSLAVTAAAPGQLKLPNGVEPFKRTQGASEIAARVDALLKENNVSTLLVADRRMAALMHYYLRDSDIEILTWRHGDVPHDHFEMANAYQITPVEPVLLVSRTQETINITSRFGEAASLGAIAISAGEIPQIHAYRLDQYQP